MFITMRAVFLILGAVILLLKSWACDDAYITFRVVDNFVNGYGLRWNIDERVQVYTHPLWLLVHIPVVWVLNNVFLSSILLSLFFSLCSICILSKHIKDSHGTFPSLLFLLICFSTEVYTSFSTSGLENPLLLFIITLYIHYARKYPDHAFEISFFFCSLSSITRLDSILIFAPIIILQLLRTPKKFFTINTFLLLTPLIAWCLFSLFYYGFIFPNTYVAKQGVQIDRMRFIEMGLLYCYDFLKNDPIASFPIFMTSIFLLNKKYRKELGADHCMLFLGSLLYITYVIYIGGDFMSGRFFYIPMLISLYTFLITSWYTDRLSRCLFILGLICCLSVNDLIYHRLPGTKIYNQRHLYSNPKMAGVQEPPYSMINLYALSLRTGLGDHFYLQQLDSELVERRGHLSGLTTRGAVGIYGYYAGPQNIVIDYYALTDPFLSRLPYTSPLSDHLPIGHFKRDIPIGYKEARCHRDLSKLDDSTRSYYQDIATITQSEIFSIDRLKLILKFNFDLVEKPTGYRIESESSPLLLRDCNARI